MRSGTPFFCTILLITSAACASGTGLSSSSPNPRRYDTLTTGELKDFTDVASAVITLRPRWASSRGCPPGQTASVFVNRLPSQGAEVLAGIRPDEAREIRHFSASEAMIQFGGSHPCGAILVLTWS
jgi:hypothetical protein